MDLTADKILSIPISSPESLFTSDGIKEEYHKLVMQWHPDKNGNSDVANKVSAHINILYDAGLKLLNKGSWHIPGLLILTSSTTATSFKIKYKYHHSFELGETYVCDTVLVYAIRKEFKNLYDNGVSRIRSFKFANDGMKDEFTKYLPSIKREFETEDYYVLILNKTKDVLPLSIILKYFDGKVPVKHVAWIMSSLHNMLCYLNYADIVHNAIDLNNYFISPEFHSGLLLGGWWYSVKKGDTIKSVPTRTFNYMSGKAKRSKTAENFIDDELSRAVGRALLGDESGSRLAVDPTIPTPMLNWIRLFGSKNRIEDYKNWKEILVKSFGKIEFVPMIININEVYNKVKEK